MEELNDDELQELLGRMPITGDNKFGEKATNDLLAYQDLFKTLQTEPEQGLPLSFASKVKRKVQERLNLKNDIRFNIMAAIIFIISLMLGYGMLQLISSSTAELILIVVLKFKWVFGSVILLFFTFLLIDQRLVKRDY
ncbi:MAG: hypothetical protein ABWY16_10975 [Pedobacter sp.]|jgi:hypothetical protein|uniref:hypothetical protein n=1 Tax=Pedobacter sp. TaxID=1411316 RepID=UPI0033930A80